MTDYEWFNNIITLNNILEIDALRLEIVILNAL